MQNENKYKKYYFKISIFCSFIIIFFLFLLLKYKIKIQLDNIENKNDSFYEEIYYKKSTNKKIDDFDDSLNEKIKKEEKVNEDLNKKEHFPVDNKKIKLNYTNENCLPNFIQEKLQLEDNSKSETKEFKIPELENLSNLKTSPLYIGNEMYNNIGHIGFEKYHNYNFMDFSGKEQKDYKFIDNKESSEKDNIFNNNGKIYPNVSAPQQILPGTVGFAVNNKKDYKFTENKVSSQTKENIVDNNDENMKPNISSIVPSLEKVGLVSNNKQDDNFSENKLSSETKDNIVDNNNEKMKPNTSPTAPPLDKVGLVANNKKDDNSSENKVSSQKTML